MNVVHEAATGEVGSPVATVLERHVRETRLALAAIPTGDTARAVELILRVARRGGHVYIVGNGGSAATASHFACDLSKSTIVDSQRRLRATSLTDSAALLTAWANDTAYERAFAEQLMNLIQPADLLLAISVSGSSPNVLAAVAVAQERGAATAAFVGRDGGALKQAVDVAVQADSVDYGVVEDCHLVLLHAVTASIRSALRG